MRMIVGWVEPTMLGEKEINKIPMRIGYRVSGVRNKRLIAERLRRSLISQKLTNGLLGKNNPAPNTDTWKSGILISIPYNDFKWS